MRRTRDDDSGHISRRKEGITVSEHQVSAVLMRHAAPPDIDAEQEIVLTVRTGPPLLMPDVCATLRFSTAGMPEPARAQSVRDLHVHERTLLSAGLEPIEPLEPLPDYPLHVDVTPGVLSAQRLLGKAQRTFGLNKQSASSDGHRIRSAGGLRHRTIGDLE